MAPFSRSITLSYWGKSVFVCMDIHELYIINVLYFKWGCQS